MSNRDELILTTEQKKGLHHCPGCGHLNQSHYSAGCMACDPYLDDHESCGRIPKLIETTYENVEALLAETVAAMRAELDATHTTIARLRNAGTWSVDPYDEPAWTQGHWHSEPACAWPDCATYLTRSQMAALHVEGGGRR